MTQPNDSGTSVSSNGKSMLRIPLSTMGYASSILTLIVFCIGFVTGALTFKAKMDIIGEHLASLSARVDALNTGAANDRQAITERLGRLEENVKNVKEGVAEVRSSLIPRK